MRRGKRRSNLITPKKLGLEVECGAFESDGAFDMRSRNSQIIVNQFLKTFPEIAAGGFAETNDQEFVQGLYNG
jgi:hypothetical protein